MDLAKLESTIPIKAIPEQELNKIILTQFTVWVANLLSLTDETSANRLEIALPAIKEHCWSMGFVEIKKMFTLYVDGKLSVKPIPNYFDRILLGKIVEAYKEQKPPKKTIIKSEISEEEKQRLISIGVKKCLKHYENTSEILDGYVPFLYDIFSEDGFLPMDKETKNKALEDARVMLEIELGNKKSIDKKSRNQIKETLEGIQNKRSPKLILKAKELMLLDFFREAHRNNGSFVKLKSSYENNTN